ncbi:MAG: hypothetical protein NTZ05_22250, partial [Chloroflexi bacterium]|nr:hypothetical protein [Chloroflexota bacterium]
PFNFSGATTEIVWDTTGCLAGARTLTAQARRGEDRSWSDPLNASVRTLLHPPGSARTLIRCGPGYYVTNCGANGEYGDGPNDTAWRGADGDAATQWSNLEKLGSFWTATFQQPVIVAQVSLWGRGDGDTLAGRLEFSDGSQVDFGKLHPAGCRRSVSFPPRAVTTVKFRVTDMGNRITTGFRDIEAYSAPVYLDGDDCSGNQRLPAAETP